MAQWLRLHTPNAGSQGSIPGQGTRSHPTCCNCELILRYVDKSGVPEKEKGVLGSQGGEKDKLLST